MRFSAPPGSVCKRSLHGIMVGVVQLYVKLPVQYKGEARLAFFKVYRFRDIYVYVMYYVYVKSGPSLLIESTDCRDRLHRTSIYPELIQAKKLQSIQCIGSHRHTLSTQRTFLLKQLQIVLTLTVTSATCERTLWRTKTYVGPTMGDSRLYNLSILSIERDLSSSLSFTRLYSFTVDKDRRITLNYQIIFMNNYCH